MAASSYRIALHVQPRYARTVRARSLAALCRRTLAAERAPPAELSVVVTDDATVRALNRRYRHRDAPTDVLSFSLDGDGFVLPARQLRQLGEVVISYPTAARQARAEGHTVHDELAHLLVHGVLHLLGYDHQRPRETQRMHAREEALLGRAAH
jgi:rRNA maturation RNase YbeY